MGFRKPQFPGKSGILDGTSGRRPGASVISGDQDHACPGLCHAGRHRADPGLGHQLDGNPGVFVCIFTVIDQLGQILNGINVVVRRRGDQAHPRRGMTGLRDPRIYLSAGQMAAFSGLRALGHLNLDLPCADQIPGGHAEPARGHLLYSGAPVGIQPLHVLAALAAVGFSMDLVHGDGQRLMGLLGNGSVGHGAGLEPGHDGIYRLHILNGNAFFRPYKIQLAPEVDLLPLLVHHPGILLEHVITAPPGGLLQHVDGLRVVQMLLAAALGFVFSHAVQGHIHLQPQGVKRLGMEGNVISCNLLDADAAHTAHRIGKILVYKFGFQADGLKDLRPLVGLDRGDPHLGRDLDDPVEGRIVVVVDRRVIVLVQKPGINQLADGLMGQVGVDGAGAIPQKGCEMMHLPGLPGFQDHGNRGSLLGPYQMLLQAGDGKQ